MVASSASVPAHRLSCSVGSAGGGLRRIDRWGAPAPDQPGIGAGEQRALLHAPDAQLTGGDVVLGATHRTPPGLMAGPRSRSAPSRARRPANTARSPRGGRTAWYGQPVSHEPVPGRFAADLLPQSGQIRSSGSSHVLPCRRSPAECSYPVHHGRLLEAVRGPHGPAMRVAVLPHHAAEPTPAPHPRTGLIFDHLPERAPGCCGAPRCSRTGPTMGSPAIPGSRAPPTLAPDPGREPTRTVESAQVQTREV